MFGLSLELDSRVEDKDSFAINIAGPVMNLSLVIICLAINFLFPISIVYLNTFCISNLVLAVFNMLPVYPLDGGKIVSSMISKDKVFKRVDFFSRIAISILFIVLFVLSFDTVINFWWLIIAIFFLSSRTKREANLTIFKYTKNKHIDKVVMYKITGEESIYDLVKKIANNRYTIFYYRIGKNHYIDEDRVIDLATKLPLKSKLKDIMTSSNYIN